MEQGRLSDEFTYALAEMLAPPEPAVRRTKTNPESVVAMREKSSKPRDVRGSPPVKPRSTGGAGDRKFTVRCYSTDTALDFTQGAYTQVELEAVTVGSRDGVHCRRSASLQQHSTIAPGTYKKLEGGGGGGVTLVRGGVSGSSGGMTGFVPRKRPPMVRQRTKLQTNSTDLHYSCVSVPSPDPCPPSPDSPGVPLALPDGPDTQSVPTWNNYLYQLQLEAPQPTCIPPKHEVPNRPPQYDQNEFHGKVSRQEADILLQGGDGCYIVRRSERAENSFTLAIRFDGETKNYKLYYDGQHYVGEKRFDCVHDLVADGLIHFYIELRAADYIKTLSQESNYEESPYMAYNRRIRTRTEIGTNGVAVEANQSDYESTGIIGPATNVIDYEKPHIFKVQNFMGHWCDFCANFMWGLIAQGVKCQDCGFQAHKRCSEKVPNDCMPDMKYVKRIFGGDLTTVVKAQKSLIPMVVEKCVKEIELRGMDQEGLYRLAGFHDDVEGLRMSFDKDADNADVSANKYEDINTVCSALKLYFRLLPIPLITCEVYKRLMEIIKNEDLSQADQVRQMKEPMNSLPPAHFHTLKYMCAHLKRVVEFKAKNMMSSENLAIVFAPTLMRSDDADPMASLMAAKFEQKLMEAILVNHTKLLGR